MHSLIWRDEIRTLGVGLQSDPLAAISLSNITRTDGQRKMYKLWRRNIDKYFLAAERMIFMAYQFCAEKAENFLETSPGVIWGELKELMHRCYTETVHPATTDHQTFRKSVEEYSLVSIFKNSWVVRNNRSPGMEKQLISTFKKGLPSMGVQIQIIRQNPASLEEAICIAMSETSIQS